MTDELPPLPLPAYEAYYYSAVQMRAYATATVAREREKWIGGIKVSFPTDAMEQEIASHVRRAVGREREKWADTLRNMAAVSWGEWDERADPIEQGKAIALDHAAELLWPAIRAESECNTPQPEPPADGHWP